MHDIVKNELEKHFTGDASTVFYEHLAQCSRCHSEVSEMDELTLLVREMKAPLFEVPEPRLGFYNRVVGDIVEQNKKESWSLFSPGAAFFRRIVFASLLVLASLGSFLVTRENAEGGVDAAAILAQHDSSGTTRAEGSPADGQTAGDPNRILVTLAAYR